MGICESSNNNEKNTTNGVVKKQNSKYPGVCDIPEFLNLHYFKRDSKIFKSMAGLRTRGRQKLK